VVALSRICLVCLIALHSGSAQDVNLQEALRDRASMRITFTVAPDVQTHRTARLPPIVAWLTPQPGTQLPSQGSPEHAPYVLLQRDKMFTPHVLVVPVGAIVSFPNADPYFHNVFSLFEGRRFDLGLYEAGTTRQVKFPREGVSYIFCNIHPAMSAVVVALATPFYGIADTSGTVEIHDVTPGAYQMHVWVEGATPEYLKSLVQPVHIHARVKEVATVPILVPIGPKGHTNLYGQPYDTHSDDTY
jgi:plastocyanin